MLNYTPVSRESLKCPKMERMQSITKNSSQTGEAGFRHSVLTLSTQSLIFLGPLSGNWYKELSSVVVGQQMPGRVRSGCRAQAGVYLIGVLEMGLLRLVSDSEIDLPSNDLLAASNLNASQITLHTSPHYLGVPIRY